MLVLSRKRDENVRLVDLEKMVNLGTVTVLEIRGDKVRLGFEFPKSVGIHREEVWAAMQANGEQPATDAA